MAYESPINEWDELQAGQLAELELAQIALFGRPPCSSRELDLARRDAMRAMVTGLPDPRDVAAYLETADPEAAETLKQAWISNKQPYAGTWRVADCASTPVLRAMGLVGWIGRGRGMGCSVSGFGLLVRKMMIFDVDSRKGDA
ncbi:MAG: hypothetical protein WC692_07565 [Erythrobacter sp.]|jgi:hypothetical protein